MRMAPFQFRVIDVIRVVNKAFQFCVQRESSVSIGEISRLVIVLRFVAILLAHDDKNENESETERGSRCSQPHKRYFLHCRIICTD